MNLSDITKKHQEAYEANKEAKIARQEREHKEKVKKWLSENPEIGVLNGNKYYKFENGQQVQVKELG